MVISKRRKLERNLPKSFTNLCDFFMTFFLQMGGDSFLEFSKKSSLEYVANDFKKLKKLKLKNKIKKKNKMAIFCQKKKKR